MAKSNGHISVSMINSIVDGVDEGTCIAEESHQAAEDVTIVPEEQSENGGKPNDVGAGSEGKNSAEENAEKEMAQEHEEEKDQECEINNEDQECEINNEEKQGNAEEGSRPESCPDRKSCTQSDSEVDAVPHNESNTETEKNASEMIVEEAHEGPPTDQERAGSVTELCEVPQVCHFSSFTPCFSVFLCVANPDG